MSGVVKSQVRRDARWRSDVVYTPDWVVDDMLTHFAPSGRVLDPCSGDGAFLDKIPGADWCEITKGRDFFQWAEPVDWVIGNPPYSITREWFKHSYQIADNVCYLLPVRNVFSAYGFLREVDAYGGIVAVRVYGTGNRLGFPMGNAIGAVHLQRDYRADTQFTFYDERARFHRTDFLSVPTPSTQEPHDHR